MSWRRRDNNEPEEADTVYISGLPKSIKEDDLIKLFGSIGKIKMKRGKGRDRFQFFPVIKIYRDKDTGEPKGDATVSYEDPYTAGCDEEIYKKYVSRNVYCC
eukprot:jgi/Bigna1/137841/aug1.41_g12549